MSTHYLTTCRPGAMRELLGLAFKTDAEFDAFCIDYFPQVYRLFSNSMDRLSKTNLLIIHIEPEVLLERLKLYIPERTLEHGSSLTSDDNENETQSIQAAISILQRRQALLAAQMRKDPDIDNQLLEFRRKLRNGPSLHEQELLSGRYELLKRIGEGGIGEVWQAYDQRLQQLVAVKILHRQWSKDQSYRERFDRGARQMLRLSHQNIVRILSEPCSDERYFYFVMEYVPGDDLQSAILNNRISSHQALMTVLQVGKALDLAHHANVIHRDVKPANILLGNGGIAKLTDFDLVLCQDSTGGTRTGAMGSFLYASPEEMEDAKNVDQRADIYSLGMTALFSLYRKPLPLTVLTERSRFLKQLNCHDAIKRIISKSISLDPKDRYPSVGAFCQRLIEELGQLNEYRDSINGYQRLDNPHPRYVNIGKWIVLDHGPISERQLDLECHMREVGVGRDSEGRVNQFSPEVELRFGDASGTSFKNYEPSSIHPKADILVKLIEVRGLGITHRRRQSILDCKSDFMLDHWIKQIILGSTVEDLFRSSALHRSSSIKDKK